MTRSRAALLLVLAAVITTVVVWRPWDPVPDELRDAVAELARLPGVVTVDVEYREIPATPAVAFTPEPSRADVSVRLDARLTPADAGSTAARAHAILVPAADAVAGDAVTVFLRITAGEPENVNGVQLDRVVVPFTTGSGADDVADAFSIWQAGARSVRVNGTGSPVGDGTSAGFTQHEVSDSAAGIGIEAADPADLVALAELAADLGRPADLRVTGNSAQYSGYGSVPDVDAVRLAAATASRPGVESAVFSNSLAPELSVSTVWPAESPATQELRDWLEAHDYATRLGRPVAFTIAEPGYATLTHGWVSAFSPPEPEPHPLPLPAGIEAWPDDADAPACTGADLEVTFGGSDAATGARYALLLARNASDRPCVVDGVPHVKFRTAGGAAHQDVRLEPYRPGVVPDRLVVPPGEQVRAPLQWRAVSTADGPDLTTSIEVIAVPGADPVLLDVAAQEGSAAGLDILDGAEVRLGPWVQAIEGWS